MLLNIKTFIRSINDSWLNFKLQTQILLASTVLLSFLITSVAYWSFATAQNSPNINNSRFVNDINSLLRDNILSLIEEKKSSEILSFCERFYKNSTSLRYIIFIDQMGVEYGIPYSYRELVTQDNFSLSRYSFGKKKLVTNSVTNFDTTTSNIMILANEQFLGLLLVGNNSKLTPFNSVLLKNEIILVVIIIFISLFILGTIFLKFTITRPLNEVSQGLKSIAAGNFSHRITVRFGGEFGDLSSRINGLGRRLQMYEEANRKQIVSEKIKLESLITTITDGALLLDTNLRIVLVNTPAIRIFGWKTKTRLIGTPIWDHLPIVLQKKLFVTLQDILVDAQTAIFDGVIENDLTQFSKRSIRIILNLVYDSLDVNKIPIGIGVTIQDMTKEVELVKTQNRFMSNISHELRTPLFNIKSFIETIQEYDYTLSNCQKRYFLDIVNKETNRLTRLVNDILCLSKLDSLNEKSLGEMNVAETINQTTANYQIIARDKNLYLHSEIAKINLNVQGNKDLLFQVLINLVGNALKFSYRKGEVIIRAYPLKKQKIRVEVVDTGVGIVYSYQQSIFQRFYRVENDVHTLKGAGLGLSIVETILSEHKTVINLVSRANVGSAFWFDLTVI